MQNKADRLKTLEALETEYYDAHARYVAAKGAYENYGSEIAYLAAKEACIEAGRALFLAQGGAK